jgi:hypothetical protein
MECASSSPLRILWLNVILDAVQAAMEEPHPKVRAAAHYWLLADERDFPAVCFLAGIEHTYLRRQLRTRLKSFAPGCVMSDR